MDPLRVYCTIDFVVPAEPAKSKLYFFNLHLDILRLFMTAERIVNEGFVRSENSKYKSSLSFRYNDGIVMITYRRALSHEGR